jgi:aminoglycoside phosphotransferase (APT) family kinase protein
LYYLREDAPRRVRAMEETGPEMLLHGDLWPQNVFVSMADGVPRARLIDWDHVGVGPFSYDLSTFLYRSAAEERLWLLGRYRAAAERAGRHLPGTEELNLLFHTAESARFAHSILFDAMAVLNDGAAWAIERLMDYALWFETLRPPLAE